MEPDHAADLLMQLPQERRGPILERLEPDQQRKVRSLLGYHPETAGGLMNNEFVALPAELTVEEALSRLRAMVEVPAVLTDVFVVEGDRLVGALRLSALVRADPKARLGNVAPPDPEAVFTDADLPSVAVQMADYNLSSLPVIDGEGRLVGIVTFDDLIEAMLPDQWRWRGRPDAARLPSHQTERARPA
jgi:Mg/Co/Ni transporter MgtE